MKIPHNSSQRPLSSLARLMECVLKRGESCIGGGRSTANVIGNPVDDKNEGVIMFFGGCSSSWDGFCF